MNQINHHKAINESLPQYLILQGVFQEWNVKAMPTIIFIKGGKAVDKIVGAKKNELERKVTALAAQAALVTQA
jgi:thioredoxin 1